MPYRVKCPHCQTAYSIPDDALGRALQCKKCQKPFTIGKPKTSAPAPAAAKPPQSAAPKAAINRTPTDLPPRPAAKTPPQREAVQASRPPAVPPKRKKLPLLIAGGLLVLGGAVGGAVVAGIYFFKAGKETPVVQISAPKNKSQTPNAPPANKKDEKAETKTLLAETTSDNSAPQKDKRPSSPPPLKKPQPPDPPVADRAELSRPAEVGKPYKYQLSHPTEKIRMYTLHSGPKGMKMSKEGLIQWTPEKGQIGSHKLIVGAVSAKMSGAHIYTVRVADANAATVTGLPADLDRVPRDVLAFCSLRVADTLKRPVAADFRKQLQQQPTLQQYKLLLGLGVEDIERVVVVFLALKPEVEGVALVTTVKPYVRDRLLLLIGPETREMKFGTATYHVGKKYPAAVHFLNDRTFIVGLGKDVKKFLQLPIGKDKPGPLSDALAFAAGSRTLVFAARPKSLIPIEKKDVPPPYQSYLPLLDARNALLSLGADRDLRIEMRFAFANEEQAQKGEKAAKQALSMASLIVRQFPTTLAKIPVPEFKPLLPKLNALLDLLATALADKPPRREALLVTHSMRIQSPDWLQTLVAAAPFLAPRPVKPEPRKVQAPKTPEEAEAAIKKLGGKVERNEKAVGKPIVGVKFLSVGITDDDLAVLRVLPTLKKVDLYATKKITDKGIQPLLQLTDLEELSLGSMPLLTDAALADLKKLTKLKTLKLLGIKITDKGVHSLKDLPALEELSLHGDRGITARALDDIKEFKKLKDLDLNFTGLSIDAVKEFMKARPDIILHF